MSVLQQRKSPLLINISPKTSTFAWLAEHAAAVARRAAATPGEGPGMPVRHWTKPSGEFDSVDSKLLNSIANESAIYLENAMLYEDVHGLMMGLLHSLTSAVDAKDAYTCGHSERVALLSRYLAQQIRLDDHAGRAHLHGRPAARRRQDRRARSGAAEDRQADAPKSSTQIKKHPEIGARILRDIKQIEDIIPGVLHHHERYDGKGYPAGLGGRKHPADGSNHLPGRLLRRDDQQPHISQGAAAGGRADGNPPLLGHAVRSDADRRVSADRCRTVPRAAARSPGAGQAADRCSVERRSARS